MSHKFALIGGDTLIQMPWILKKGSCLFPSIFALRPEERDSFFLFGQENRAREEKEERERGDKTGWKPIPRVDQLIPE